MNSIPSNTLASTYFTRFQKDMLFYILSFLPHPDLGTFFNVCKSHNQIQKDREFWKLRFSKVYPIKYRDLSPKMMNETTESNKKVKFDWCELYKQCSHITRNIRKENFAARMVDVDASDFEDVKYGNDFLEIEKDKIIDISEEGSIRIVDLTSAAILLNAENQKPIWSIKIFEDQLLAGLEGEVQVWDLVTNKLALTCKADDGREEAFLSVDIEEPGPKGLRDSSTVKDKETYLYGSPNSAMKSRDCGLASVQNRMYVGATREGVIRYWNAQGNSETKQETQNTSKKNSKPEQELTLDHIIYHNGKVIANQLGKLDFVDFSESNKGVKKTITERFTNIDLKNDKIIAFGSDLVKCFDLSGNELHEIKANQISTYLLDTETFIFGTNQGIIEIWEHCGVFHHKWEAHTHHSIIALDVLADNFIVSVADLETQTEIKVWDFKGTLFFTKTVEGSFNRLTCSYDHVVFTVDMNSIHIWDFTQKPQKKENKPDILLPDKIA